MLDKIEKKAKNDKRAKTKSLYATLQLLIFTMSLKEITQSFLDREFSGLFSDAVLFEKSKVFSSYQAQQISLQYRVRKPRYKELKLSGNDSYEKKHEIRLFTYTPEDYGFLLFWLVVCGRNLLNLVMLVLERTLLI